MGSGRRPDPNEHRSGASRLQPSTSVALDGLPLAYHRNDSDLVASSRSSSIRESVLSTKNGFAKNFPPEGTSSSDTQCPDESVVYGDVEQLIGAFHSTKAEEASEPGKVRETRSPLASQSRKASGSLSPPTSPSPSLSPSPSPSPSPPRLRSPSREPQWRETSLNAILEEVQPLHPMAIAALAEQSIAAIAEQYREEHGISDHGSVCSGSKGVHRETSPTATVPEKSSQAKKDHEIPLKHARNEAMPESMLAQSADLALERTLATLQRSSAPRPKPSAVEVRSGKQPSKLVIEDRPPAAANALTRPRPVPRPRERTTRPKSSRATVSEAFANPDEGRSARASRDELAKRKRRRRREAMSASDGTRVQGWKREKASGGKSLFRSIWDVLTKKDSTAKRPGWR